MRSDVRSKESADKVIKETIDTFGHVIRIAIYLTVNSLIYWLTEQLAISFVQRKIYP